MNNVNPKMISLFTGLDDTIAVLKTQKWCHEMLQAEQVELTVWFFADAVEHVLPRPSNDAVYAAWEDLAASGLRLRACKAACQRRLAKEYLEQELFEISSLTQWADQVIGVENSITCVLKRPATSPKFVREQIDQVLVLLALDISVKVVFNYQALNHLLDESNWRQWRMLPELEENVSMVAISSGLRLADINTLESRKAVEIVSEDVSEGLVIDV